MQILPLFNFLSMIMPEPCSYDKYVQYMATWMYGCFNSAEQRLVELVTVGVVEDDLREKRTTSRAVDDPLDQALGQLQPFWLKVVSESSYF